MTKESTRDAFRLWAFHSYYQVYREEKNLSLRFVMALVASSRPVSDEMIEAWRASKKELRALRRAQDSPRTRLRWPDYWQAVFDAILRHIRADAEFRAWEVPGAAEDGAEEPADADAEGALA